MDAGTQSALLMIWALFWMLVLSLMMVHPMFRATRIQIRRSLRQNLSRWNTTRQLLRARMLRFRGRFLVRVGKTLLWMAHGLEKRESRPTWLRLLIRLPGRLLYIYLFFHLLFRQPLTWPEVLSYVLGMEVLDALHNAWKRRKQRLQGSMPGSSSTMKPAEEQRAEP
jgi:hypothetical protein